ncbi:NmrA family NAD(P)-binding protein, partial [Herbaspirillum lusitanum]
MKVFITGATGYVGGSIAVHLIKAGHSVRGLVRDMRKADALAQLGVEAVQGDLDDRDVLIREARAA